MSNENNTVKSNETANVEAKAVKFVRTNRNQRESVQAGGCGLNCFGSFCSDGVRMDLAEKINASRTLLDEQTLNGESETVFHLTESEKHGLHAGICQRFAGIKLADDSTADVLVKTLADGTRVYYTAEVCKGFALISDAEIIALAKDANDLRQFRQKVRGADGSFMDGEAVRGALVKASLSKDYNALIYRTADGLSVRTLLTRKAKEHETEFFVETSQIKDADKASMASEIFEGVKVKKAKDETRNAARRARAAAVKAKKATK